VPSLGPGRAGVRGSFGPEGHTRPGDPLSLDPQDAEDAAQEILIRVLPVYVVSVGKAAFELGYIVLPATRCLHCRRQRAEQRSLSFEQFGEDLAHGCPMPL